jgi:hypothetical protein
MPRATPNHASAIDVAPIMQGWNQLGEHDLAHQPGPLVQRLAHLDDEAVRRVKRAKRIGDPW